MKQLSATAMVLLALSFAPARADSLRANHPLIGTWRIDLPTLSCHEIYRIRANGTTLVTSGQEVAESTFSLSDRPTERGFYKWVDKITRDNGKKDCAGEVMEIGHESTNYIIMHPSGNQFLMCEEEDIKTCIGPFNRLKDEDV